MKHLTTISVITLSLLITNHIFSSFFFSSGGGISTTSDGYNTITTIGNVRFHQQGGTNTGVCISGNSIQVGGLTFSPEILEQFAGQDIHISDGQLRINGSSISAEGTPRFESTNPTETYTKQFDGISMVEIDNSSGKVTINAHDSDKTDVTIRHSKRNRITERIHGNRLSLKTETTGMFSAPTYYTVKVPERCDLLVRVASALIEIAGGHGRTETKAASGDTDIKNRSGSFVINSSSGRASTFGTSGPLRVHSASGDTTVRNHKGDISRNASSGYTTTENTSGILQIHSASGDARVHNHQGAFQRNSSSGNTQLINTNSRVSSVAVQSASGDTRLELVDDDVSLDFSSTSGDIAVTLPGMSTMRVGKKFATRLGAGRKSIRASASSGDITYIKRSTNQ